MLTIRFLFYSPLATCFNFFFPVAEYDDDDEASDDGDEDEEDSSSEDDDELFLYNDYDEDCDIFRDPEVHKYFDFFERENNLKRPNQTEGNVNNVKRIRLF